MLQIGHVILMFLYLALPPLMLIYTYCFHPPGSRPWETVKLAIASSGLLGIGASIIYSVWLHGVPVLSQVLLTCYWAGGLVCLLKILDLTVDHLTAFCFGIGHGKWRRADRRAVAHIARIVLLFLIGLPYMIAAAAVYRPRLLPQNDSGWAQLGAQAIQFSSTDGVKLSGLWIPALPATVDQAKIKTWGRQTIIICPGMRGTQYSYLAMATDFRSAGYNVLAFDFRAHGQSGGQMISFGDLESRDVLGAVRWVRGSDPERAHRIVGIGMDTGAAALLAAAADRGPEGSAIAALALVGCYDRLDLMAADVSRLYFLPPLNWLVRSVGLPLASLQTGVDLSSFSPEQNADRVAPRPILFIHRISDPIISFSRGSSLFENASEPKEHLWLKDTRGTPNDPANDPSINPQVIESAREFLDTAIPIL